MPSPAEAVDKDACMLPQRARELPAGSLSRLVASKCLRLYWHLVFDPAPRLLEHFGSTGRDLFEPFMAWADERGLSLDWTLHLHLWTFLVEELRPALADDREAVVEVLAATASRFARTDLTADLGVVLGARALPGEVVLGWKGASLTAPKQVQLARLDGGEPLATAAGWILLGERGDAASQAVGRTWSYTLR